MCGTRYVFTSIFARSVQVPPAELEDLLRTLPGVSDVAVIGVSHERFGEAPRAYIVKKEGEELTEEKVGGRMGERAVVFLSYCKCYKHLKTFLCYT